MIVLDAFAEDTFFIVLKYRFKAPNNIKHLL